MTAAIYARKSTDQVVSDEQKSVTRQIEHARAYATRRAWTVDDAHVYVDDGISGAEFANRPGFMRLMASLGSKRQRPPFQILIVSEISRLGREQLETGYALKQLSQAGVKIYSYLDGREIALESAVDKFLMTAVNFAAELEREKARQRTYDALHRKAGAGHVTGGACFGYRNIEVNGPDGRRSHVTREIDPEQAATVRRIFELCAAGHGVKQIGKTLNEERAQSPRAQRGRSQTWAPSSVREVLHRSTYRGEITWNASRKRDRWGQQRQTARPEAEWMRVPAPELRIVSEELWSAAHARIAASRALYLKGTGGNRFGRPAVGSASRYLLTNLTECAVCGGPLRVRTRKVAGGERARFYGCAAYHERGSAVCGNRSDVPMGDADAVVLEALLDDVLTPPLLSEAVDGALALLQEDSVSARLEVVMSELAKAQHEKNRLVSAVTISDGQLESLIAALRERESRISALQGERVALESQRRASRTDAARMRDDLTALAREWRRVLSEEPSEATRPVLSRLLKGRVQVRAT